MEPGAPPNAATLAAWIRLLLGDQFPESTNGVWQPGDGRPLRRLGVALAGSASVAAAARDASVDALLLHRPWWLETLPPQMAVLAFHEALDNRLTTGNNPWLAAALGFALGETISEQQDRPLVCLAQALQSLTVGDLLACLHLQFPHNEFAIQNPLPSSEPIHTIALANAMRPTLVALAAHRGATLYLTGTLRPAAQVTLLQTSMMAVGLGHEAIERWGLRWLATAIQTHFPIEIVWLD